MGAGRVLLEVCGGYAMPCVRAHAHVLDQVEEVMSRKEAGVVDQVFQCVRRVFEVSDLTEKAEGLPRRAPVWEGERKVDLRRSPEEFLPPAFIPPTVGMEETHEVG
jgi:hypothetical protein